MHPRRHDPCSDGGMLLSSGSTVSLVGLDARPLVVECRITKGLPSFEIVGVPERMARECVVRVRAAIASAGFELPPRHVVLNVAPADVRKSGHGLDLPVALATLTALGHAPESRLRRTGALGELSLGGALRPVRGSFAMLQGAARALRDGGVDRMLVARDDHDAGIVRGLELGGVGTLGEALEALRGGVPLVAPRALEPACEPTAALDLADVAGQDAVKRALLVAAAGSHALLLSGPPGTGKTMLARRLSTLLPPPDEEERVELARIRSAAGFEARIGDRPFRAPHHTASASALVGGGDPLRPGEVTLAHGGVLFLDELPEFRRDALESLRTILEEGQVALARVHGRVVLPARAQVVAAMNPCPCGFLGDATRVCRCAPDRVERYRGRISGPLLDRFDLHAVVPRVAASQLVAGPEGPSSAALRERVVEARRRLASGAGTPRAIAASASEAARTLLERAVDRLGLSARVHGKTWRVARTLAALRNSDVVSAEDVAEALSYRGVDRRSAVAADPSP